jgi:hypothetical protein
MASNIASYDVAQDMDFYDLASNVASYDVASTICPALHTGQFLLEVFNYVTRLQAAAGVDAGEQAGPSAYCCHHVVQRAFNPKLLTTSTNSL